MNRRLAVVVTALVLLTAGCSSSGGGQPKPSDLVGHDQVRRLPRRRADPAQPRPSFTLTDTSGKQFRSGR